MDVARTTALNPAIPFRPHQTHPQKVIGYRGPEEPVWEQIRERYSVKPLRISATRSNRWNSSGALTCMFGPTRLPGDARYLAHNPEVPLPLFRGTHRTHYGHRRPESCWMTPAA